MLKRARRLDGAVRQTSIGFARGALLVLAVSSLGAALAVSALADEATGPDPFARAAPPEPQSVGAPRQGDRATFDVTLPGLEARDALAFEWAGTRLARDAWNVEREADVVALTASLRVLQDDPERSDEPRSVDLLYAGALDPMARTSVHAGTGWGGGFPLLFPDVSIHRNSTSTLFEPPDGPLACLVRAGWQSVAFDALAGMDAGAFCAGLRDFGGALAPAGEETIAGVTGARFASAGGPAGSAIVTLAPGIPVPLRLVVASEAGTWDGTLTGFEPGSGGPPVSPVPEVPDPAPASDLAPWSPRWGPLDDRAGEWNAREAIARIEADSGSEKFQEWRRAHPDARIAQALYDQQRENGPEACATQPNPLGESWSFFWEASDSTIFLMGATLASRCVPEDAVPTPLAALARGPTTVVTECSNCPAQTDAAPSTTVAPVLTFSALERRFERYRALDSPAVTHLWFWHDAEGRALATALAEAPWATEEKSEGITFDAGTGRVFARSATVNVSVTYSPAPFTLPGVKSGSPSPHVLSASAAPRPFALDGVPEALATISAAALLLALLARAPALVVVLYTRLRRSDVLSHPKRAAIANAVRTSPGLALREILDATGFKKGVASYHTDVLARAGVLARIESGGFTRFFLAGSDDHLRFAAQAVMLSAGAEARVLSLARAEPGLHAAEIARRLGVSRPAVHRVLAKLEERGLAERRRDGARVRVFAR